jgi:hypothetical protein
MLQYLIQKPNGVPSMTDSKTQSARADNRQSESGNVLFLILIAVALFAALSYAVTQSSRSGSGEATSEKSLISGAQVTQYPAGVRTDIIRMMIDSNIAVDKLDFNAPSDFGSLVANPSGKFTTGVFHPDGGGATYQLAPSDVMDNASPGTWYYNASFYILNIGTTPTSDSSGNELTAFLPGIKQSVCQKIDDALGIASSPVPVVTGAASTYETQQGTGTGYTAFPTTAGTQIVSSSGASLDGQPFGCFATTDATPLYVYYHVLLER